MAISQVHDRYRAFANAERVQLIRCLSTPKSVSDLQERCTLSQSALSQHLKVLRESEIVTAHREGRHIVYQIADKKVLQIAHLLQEVAERP